MRRETFVDYARWDIAGPLLINGIIQIPYLGHTCSLQAPIASDGLAWRIPSPIPRSGGRGYPRAGFGINRSTRSVRIRSHVLGAHFDVRTGKFDLRFPFQRGGDLK